MNQVLSRVTPWLKTPDGVPRDHRLWEWIIPYTILGVVLAINWPYERLRGRWL